MNYEYDVFVSFRRLGNIPSWVEDILVPELRARLGDWLPQEPRIALDTDVIETGDNWPIRLSNVHAKSKVFLMVLSANYFRSGWCSSEWRNAVDRQNLVAAANPEIERHPLVIPVRYNDLSESDIQSLPEPIQHEVRALQRVDFGTFTTLVNPRSDNDCGHEFRNAVVDLCENKLRHAIESAPPIDDDWPRLPIEPLRSDDPTWSAQL